MKQKIISCFTALLIGITLIPASGFNSVVKATDQQELEKTDSRNYDYRSTYFLKTSDERKNGSVDGYDYEFWNIYQEGTAADMKLGKNGAFSCSWSDVYEALFHTGKKFEYAKTYHDYGEITLDYDIDYDITGSSFTCVNGEYRAKNVTVGGALIDLKMTYTLASNDYLLKDGGSGYAMFKGCKGILDGAMLDNQVLLSYITEKLNGVIGNEYEAPHGKDRISEVAAAPVAVTTATSPAVTKATTTEFTKQNSSPSTGDNEASVIFIFSAAAAIAFCTGIGALASKKKK